MSRFAPGFLKRAYDHGSQLFTASGNFTWPDAESVTVECIGGGASGELFSAGNIWTGSSGSNTTFNGTDIVAKGGAPNGAATATGSGGTGYPGQTGTIPNGGAAGASGSGVGGAAQTSANTPGNNYGGAGSGAGGGAAIGGSGGETRVRVYPGTDFTPGTVIPFVVGSGGIRSTSGPVAANNAGAPGAVKIVWS